MNITPAAVGQLVKTLEDYQCFPLFYRQNTGKTRLTITPLAKATLPEIQAGSTGVLTVTVSPAFAAKWLLPRLYRFQSQWPDLDMRLDARLKPVDFLAHNIDIGVRYGAGQWAGLEAIKLMDEYIYPMCSSGFLQQRNFELTLDDLSHETLIHDLSMETHQGFPTWQQWLAKAGITDLTIKCGMEINNSAAVCCIPGCNRRTRHCTGAQYYGA